MILSTKHIAVALSITAATCLSSCHTEDPGPIQDYEKEFNIIDFDRLEMGDAFNITVEQGNLFEVTARGDRRNIDDLIVEKEGSTLVVRYAFNTKRKHTTSIIIQMPELRSFNFSGASDSKVYGFEEVDEMDINLSGASVCQLDAVVSDVNIKLSGASSLYMFGEGSLLTADISGASVLKAFQYPVANANMKVSGASDAKVSVSSSLNAVVTGASVILYRGNPVVSAEVSGASSVHQD